jgi:hypothetical protein
MTSTSFSASAQTLQITARLTRKQGPDDRKESFESVREDIPFQHLFRMASAYEDELSEFMWGMVINKITTHMDDKMARDEALREKIASEKNWDESKGGVASDSASSTKGSDNPFELFKKVPNKNWGDYSDEEDVPAKAPVRTKAPVRAKASASGPWANVASDPFPTLQSAANNLRMPPGRAPRRTKKEPVKASDASNWKSDRAKQSSSELFLFGVYTDVELKDPKVRERDWFLWESDEEGNPIGWRKPNGWFTSRPKALFRHKKSTAGNTWIHQTYDPDTRSWVTKDQETYVRMMRASTNHLH